MPTLLLLDGHSLAYRAYFAIVNSPGYDPNRWQNKNGEPTAATYGFTSKILDLLKEPPDYFAVSFDIGRTFRDDLFAEYKGTREKMPDELAVQIDRIQDVVRAFKIPILVKDGFEADDVIGTVAQLAAARNIDVIIITGDRDLLQLAAKHITVQLPGPTAKIPPTNYTPVEVEARFGVTPLQYIDYKALVGDKSDNIPGVPGIGDKTATQLLQQYKSLDGIYKHLNDLKEGVKNKLETGKESAYLSLKLATIVTDVDVEFDLEACRTGQYDRGEVKGLFAMLGFNSLLARLPEGETTDDGRPTTEEETSKSSNAPTETIIVSDAKGLKALVKKLSSAKFITIDTETTSTDQMQAELVGISLCVEAGVGYYIPVGHMTIVEEEVPSEEEKGKGKREKGKKKGDEAQISMLVDVPPPSSPLPPPVLDPNQLPLEEVIAALKPSLTNPKIAKYGHNIKYDYVMLKRYGIDVTPLSFDTMLAEWVSDPSSFSLGLKKLALVRLGIEMVEIKELLGTGKKQITMERVPIAKAAPYAVADVDMTTRLVPILQKEVKEKGQTKLLSELEMPLIPILAQMEMAGIMLDVPFISTLARDVEKQLASLEKRIFKMIGMEFNLNSPQQLSDALFGKLQLPSHGVAKTQAGKFSTAAEVLEELRDRHEVIPLILDYRELSKLKSTYLDALPAAVNPQTGRIHTSYNQSGSVTGRIASSDPNLQNIPIRSELGRRVRHAFVAAPGTVLMSADYSQIELRIAAHVSQDPTLLKAFRDNEDIHITTAASVLGIKPEQVTKDQRRQAKAVNFGILYGQGAFGLTRTTGLTLAEAEDFIKNYFARFPGVKKYLDETKKLAAERGYVETLLGRRRYFPGLSAASGNRETAIARARAEREAINAPIQGTAADVIKLAMLRLPAALEEAGLKAKLLLQVHDELVLECPEKQLKKTARLVRDIMESAFKIDIPLGVEVRSGANWDEVQVVD